MKTLSLPVALLIGILTVATTAAQQGEEASSKGLKDYASFPVGTAGAEFTLDRNPEVEAIQRREFNSVTASNAMKMAAIARDSGTYNFEVADRLVAYTQKNNMRLFGHTLIWHSSTPQWLPKLADNPAALDAFMKDYITTYVGRYKGKVAGWDVVNEVINTQGGEMRETLWYKAFGKEYIAKAFRYAHAADPEAVLFINDFNIERDTAKLHATLRLIRELRAEGVPISGLGFQMHLRMDIPDETIAYALKKGAETGLQIHLSEVDIIFNKHNDERGGGVQLFDQLTDEMKQQQSKKYENLVRMYRTIVPPNQQFGITFWGFNDKYTWINPFFNLRDWPCLFDENLQPKPAYHGFVKGLTEKIK
jgi:endo-1,4-beta-xylanase